MKATRTCSIEGCEGVHLARGLCGTHYARLRRTGDPEVDHRQTHDPVCSFPDCGRPHKAHGYCSTHANRFVKYGDPSRVDRAHLFGADHHLYRGNDIGYLAAHSRVISRFGPASGHPCSNCGEPARDWAYNHSADVELTDESGRVYSGNPEDYFPLCRSCHLHFDRGVDHALG